MSDADNNQEEFALQAMFGRTVRPVPDQGFSKAVLARVHRSIWKRRLVLLFTCATGLAIALPAMLPLITMLESNLTELAATAEGSKALHQIHTLLTALPWRESTQALNQEVARFGAGINTVSWYQTFHIYVLAGLMALFSLIVSRVLER